VDGLADVRAVTRQVELALFLAGQVDGEMIKAPGLQEARPFSRG